MPSMSGLMSTMVNGQPLSSYMPGASQGSQGLGQQASSPYAQSVPLGPSWLSNWGPAMSNLPGQQQGAGLMPGGSPTGSPAPTPSSQPASPAPSYNSATGHPWQAAQSSPAGGPGGGQGRLPRPQQYARQGLGQTASAGTPPAASPASPPTHAVSPMTSSASPNFNPLNAHGANGIMGFSAPQNSSGGSGTPGMQAGLGSSSPGGQSYAPGSGPGTLTNMGFSASTPSQLNPQGMTNWLQQNPQSGGDPFGINAFQGQNANSPNGVNNLSAGMQGQLMGMQQQNSGAFQMPQGQGQGGLQGGPGLGAGFR